MNRMKMCLNWKVAAAVAAVAGGVYLLAPSAFAAAVPLLLLAICPLSMLLMMKMMAGGGHGSSEPAKDESPAAVGESRAELEAELGRLRARQTAIADQLEVVAEQDASQRAESATPTA